MFSTFMVNTWVAATIVAVVAGVVGVFVVLRGSAFVAHAVPHGAFSGAAGAALIGANTILGLGVFAVAGALGIGWLGRRGRHDVATALALVVMLGTGALFLSFSVEYASEIYSLLFGEVLGVARSELLPIAALAAGCLLASALVYRPLLMSSVLPEVASARGIRLVAVDTCFLLIVALATAMTVPVVGAFLMFTLMVAPAATARHLSDAPGRTVVWSVAIALVTVWLSVASSYWANWPVGFFVGVIGFVAYAGGRAVAAVRSRRVRRVVPAGPAIGTSTAS